MKDLYIKIDELINHWSKWKEYKDYYLHELLPKLMANFSNGDEKEKSLLTEIKKIATKEEWDNLGKIVKERSENRLKKGKILEKLKSYLDNFDFDAAQKVFDDYPGVIRYNEFEIISNQYLDKGKKQIEQELRKGNYKKANVLYIKIRKIRKFYPPQEYQELKKHYQVKKNREEMLKKMKVYLENYDFIKTDELFRGSQYVSKDEYEDLKSEYIKKYLNENLKEKIGIPADKEKALAVAKTDKNLLLKARAGSGKTTTIAYKTFFLVNKESVNPDDIMILAFNKKAAKEIKDRIIEKFELKSFFNARTFHSLAYQMVQPKEELLFDEGEAEFSRKELSQYVQKLIWKAWDISFKTKLYMFFRKEMQEQEIKKYGLHLNSKDYYLFRKNFRQVTLRGEKVKSIGKKYIADFLYEHDIPYQYEKIFLWNGRNYKPDFTIWYKNKEFILEHLEIYIKRNNYYKNEHSGSVHNLKEYCEQIRKKREYWKNRGRVLIETSLDDLEGGRERFENILKTKLEKFGIKNLKLSEEEIINRIIEPQIARITEMFVQFIQKAKQVEMIPEDIKKKIDSSQNSFEERVKIFLELANKIYKEYKESLKKDNRIDFDDLLMRVKEIINKTEGECGITISNSKKIQMKDLKWIMIDEYQDFSQLFYDLIKTIKKYNKDLRVFCVGDDWQAINSFAGSDLRFFVNFNDFVENSGIAHLLINHRSMKRIIENSNKFMIGRGKPSTWEKDGGVVRIIDINDVKIDYKKDGQQYPDKKFIFFNSEGKVEDNCFIKARYLKKCYEIIQENPGKDIAILNRINQIYGTNLNIFYSKLKRCFTTEESRRIGIFEKKIKVGTAHSFKGLEADIVIILRVCNGSFPLIHPDNQLFEIFGQTAKEVLDEERRLFYVAITRPKEKLFILTETTRDEDKSDFLELLKT